MFCRRLQHHLHVDYPTACDAATLLRHYFGHQCPLTAEVNLDSTASVLVSRSKQSSATISVSRIMDFVHAVKIAVVDRVIDDEQRIGADSQSSSLSLRSVLDATARVALLRQKPKITEDNKAISSPDSNLLSADVIASVFVRPEDIDSVLNAWYPPPPPIFGGAWTTHTQ